MTPVTYEKSGVNIDRANRFVDAIKPLARSTRRPGVISNPGGFGALFELPVKKYRQPLLVSSTDGVGTKLKCAKSRKDFEVLGVDLVGMNVNDILTAGAEPLYFMDYFAVGKLSPGFMKLVLQGISKACRETRVALVGGETAEMPGVYRNGDFDLAGFAVGIVDKDRLIDGSDIKEGDSIIGLASSGLHANGFSMVRKVLSGEFLKEHRDEIFRSTRLYVRPIQSLSKAVDIKGMAHITGGGFYDNIPRILPKRLGALIHTGSWKIPRVFEWIRKKGAVSFREMHRTFNMGIGYVVIVRPGETQKALAVLGRAKVPAWRIGKVIRGKGVQIR